MKHIFEGGAMVMKSKKNKTTLLLITLLSLSLIITACNGGDEAENTESSYGNRPRVIIEMEDGGEMVLELYPEFAPKTVKNFVDLAESGFYDGLKFHRIYKGFMIQGGDPKGDGTGGSEKNIEGEFADNGFTKNTLKHTKGVISMARSNNPNSASSQFFIMDGDNEYLDGKYAAFGKLIDGEETLDKIANTPVQKNSFTGELSDPTVNVIIKKITVSDN